MIHYAVTDSALWFTGEAHMPWSRYRRHARKTSDAAEARAWLRAAHDKHGRQHVRMRMLHVQVVELTDD